MNNLILIAVIFTVLMTQSNVYAFMESGNYRIDQDSFQSSGGSDESSNYRLFEALGDPFGGELEGTSYMVGEGIVYEIQADGPPAPTVGNSSNYYNKLDVTLNTGGNPTDAEFAIAVSPDAFTTTKYIQSNDTIGDTLTWQTYADWGGGSGLIMLGLNPDTTYSFKARARQGDFTETGWGPTSSAATVSPQITFDLDIGDGNHSNSNAPYVIDLGELISTAVTSEETSGVSELYLDITSNAESGVTILVKSLSAGLASSSTSDAIPSSTDTLGTGSLNGGYGAAADENTAATSGTLTEVSPFNVFGVSGGVGQLSSSFQQLFTTSAPITNGDGKVALRAVAGKSTSAADDYSDIITILAVPTY